MGPTVFVDIRDVATVMLIVAIGLVMYASVHDSDAKEVVRLALILPTVVSVVLWVSIWLSVNYVTGVASAGNAMLYDIAAVWSFVALFLLAITLAFIAVTVAAANMASEW